jgi:hypothetical protein
MTFRRDDWPVCQATYTHRRIRYDGWTWVPTYYPRGYATVIIIIHRSQQCDIGGRGSARVKKWRIGDACTPPSHCTSDSEVFFVFIFFFVTYRVSTRRPLFSSYHCCRYCFVFFFLPPVKRCPAGAEVSIYRPRHSIGGNRPWKLYMIRGEENTWMTGGLTEKNKRSRFDDK